METIKSFFQSIWTKVADWAKLTWKESWTKAAAWVLGIPSAFVTVFNSIGSVITDPTFKSLISQIDIPSQVSVTLTLASIVFWVASGRKSED